MFGQGRHRAIGCAAWISSDQPAKFGFYLGRRGVKVGRVKLENGYWYLGPPTHRWKTKAEPEWYTRQELFRYSFFRKGIACKRNFTTVTCRQNREGRYYQASLNVHSIEVFRRTSYSTRRTRVFVRRF